MKINNKNRIEIAKILAPILSFRDLIDSSLMKVINRANKKKIDLDFTNVEFVSRSAAHALISLKEKLQKKSRDFFC